MSSKCEYRQLRDQIGKRITRLASKRIQFENSKVPDSMVKLGMNIVDDTEEIMALVKELGNVEMPKGVEK